METSWVRSTTFSNFVDRCLFFDDKSSSAEVSGLDVGFLQVQYGLTQAPSVKDLLRFKSCYNISNGAPTSPYATFLCISLFGIGIFSFNPYHALLCWDCILVSKTVDYVIWVHQPIGTLRRTIVNMGLSWTLQFA